MIYLCHQYPPINTPCRRTTIQLFWLPAADLVGSFPINHPWWEVSAPKNWKPFTGITQFQRKCWEKHKKEKSFRLGMGEVPILRSPVHWDDSRTSHPSTSRAPSEAFPHSKDFSGLWLTPAGNIQFSLFPLRATINKQNPGAPDLLFTFKAALRSGTAQAKAASKGIFRISLPLVH